METTAYLEIAQNGKSSKIGAVLLWRICSRNLVIESGKGALHSLGMRGRFPRVCDRTVMLHITLEYCHWLQRQSCRMCLVHKVTTCIHKGTATVSDKIILHWFINFILLHININGTLQLWALVWVHNMSKLALSWRCSNVRTYGVEFTQKKKLFDMIIVFQDVTPCSLSDRYQNIVGIGCIHRQLVRPSLFHHVWLPYVPWRWMQKITSKLY
jgi:hypothetical protein